MSETVSKRVDDSFLRKIIWIMLGTNITLLTGIGVYTQQIHANTEFRRQVGSLPEIATSVSDSLTKNYMTRNAVEQQIQQARAELRKDQQQMLSPIYEQLRDMKADIKYLVRREIEKGDGDARP